MHKWSVAVVLLLMGLFFTGFAVWQYTKTQQLLTKGGTASGTVLRLEYSASGSKSGVYYPVVKFKTDSGEEIQARSRFGSSPPEFKEGERVRIVYDRNNPKDWSINSFWDLYFLSMMFAIFGSLMVLGAIVFGFCLATGRINQAPPFQSRKL